MNEKDWEDETNKPSGYQKKLGALYGSLYQKENNQRTYPAFDSHSTIEPYVQRDHAWNHE